MAAAVIAAELRRRGRGSQTELANALGVAVGTVNKWYRGHNSPELHRWRDIERHFGWPPGQIASLTGLNRFAAHGVDDISDQVPEFALGLARDLDALRHEVRQQGARIERLVKQLGVKEERHLALAAEGGEPEPGAPVRAAEPQPEPDLDA